ncbi:MAG: DUF4870 domain-containing protein [Candidatus Pacearchaeota archaeon]|nr:DUF4870 domain-containing protein [Candidatus Pacearchaeota archaeon]
MAKKETKKNDDRILFAFLACFLSIVGFIIALVAKKQDKYVMHYAKQSLVVFIVAFILTIIAKILWIIPIIGYVVYWAIDIVILLLWLTSWIYALSGEAKEVPVIGSFARKFNF